MSLLVEAFPGTHEVAVLHVPAGATARVHHPSGPRDYRQELDVAAYAVVPGDRKAIGWGASPCWYYDVRGIRKGRHALDRPAWQDAAALLRMERVVYVTFEQVDYYGKARWTALGAGIAPAVLAEKAEASA